MVMMMIIKKFCPNIAFAERQKYHKEFLVLKIGLVKLVVCFVALGRIKPFFTC